MTHWGVHYVNLTQRPLISVHDVDASRGSLWIGDWSGERALNMPIVLCSHVMLHSKHRRSNLNIHGVTG